MEYIVFDVEYNSPGKIGKINIISDEECPFEIIEIGAVKLNENLKIVDTFRIYVRLSINKLINPLVIRKTKIKLDDLKYGFDFTEAYKNFKKWCGDNVTLCSWSNNDIIEMKRNCNYHNLEFDISDKYLDIQKLYMEAHGLENQISLKNATSNYDIQIEKDLHRALHDSMYTAILLAKTYNNELVAKNTINPNNIHFKHVKYICDISNNDVDRRKIHNRCPVCNKFARRKTQWIKGRDRNVFSLGECSSCKNKIITNANIKQKINKVDQKRIEYDVNNKIVSEVEFKRLLTSCFNKQTK